jgi:hypothetical protein
MYSENVRVLKSGGEPDLTLEAFRPDRMRHVRMHHFECDWTVMAQVVREEDRGHAATPKLTFKPIVCGQGQSELTVWLCHVVCLDPHWPKRSGTLTRLSLGVPGRCSKRGSPSRV